MDCFTLTNAHGMEVRFLAYGGTIVSVRVPDREGVFADVTPGFDAAEAYRTDGRYFGALVGRYANRIANGRFAIGDLVYVLPVNDPPNQLHGGPHAFSAREWRVAPFERAGARGAVLCIRSDAGDNGYPGALCVRVTYTLTDDNELAVDYSAIADAVTPVNLTQHAYWNLAGHDAGDILDHELTINATYFTPVDETLIPTGVLRGVTGTAFDFAAPRAIGARIGDDDEQLRIGGGYDHNFVINHEINHERPGALAFAARLRDPRSGRTLEIFTTQPGLQLYSGNGMHHGQPGKGGYAYPRHGAVALETQHFPDSPNHPHFPSTFLSPEQEFTSRTIFRFSAA